MAKLIVHRIRPAAMITATTLKPLTESNPTRDLQRSTSAKAAARIGRDCFLASLCSPWFHQGPQGQDRLEHPHPKTKSNWRILTSLFHLQEVFEKPSSKSFATLCSRLNLPTVQKPLTSSSKAFSSFLMPFQPSSSLQRCFEGTSAGRGFFEEGFEESRSGGAIFEDAFEDFSQISETPPGVSTFCPSYPALIGCVLDGGWAGGFPEHPSIFEKS